MTDILKIIGAAAVAAIAALYIKKSNPETSLVISLAAGGVILLFLMPPVLQFTAFARELSDKAGVSAGVFGVLLRCLGIAAAARIGAEMCRDAGESSLAMQLEMGGSLFAIIAALPLLKSLLTILEAWS